MRHITLIIAVVALAIAAPAIADKGGNGNGNGNGGNGNGGGNLNAAAACTASRAVVEATGLPTGEVINFMFSDSSGTWGWVLGVTYDGTASASVPTANGPTTYEFVSRTRGSDGSRYTVFASCSA